MSRTSNLPRPSVFMMAMLMLSKHVMVITDWQKHTTAEAHGKVAGLEAFGHKQGLARDRFKKKKKSAHTGGKKLEFKSTCFKRFS